MDFTRPNETTAAFNRGSIQGAHTRLRQGLAFAANLDFSRAAAGLAFAATPAHRTRGIISECGAEFVSSRFSSAVAACTIPVAR